MTSIKLDPGFLASLKKSPDDRSLEDLQWLFETLQEFEALSSLRDSALRSLCKYIRYLKRDKDDILYFRGERASCWYILLTGYVFIDGSMFCPGSSFGKRLGQRVNDCVILEPAEMIVIDYPDSGVLSAAGSSSQHAQHHHHHGLSQQQQLMAAGRRRSYASTNLERLLAMEQAECAAAVTASAGGDVMTSQLHDDMSHHHHHLNHNHNHHQSHAHHHLNHNHQPQQPQQQKVQASDDSQCLVSNMQLMSLYKNSGSRCSSDTSSAYSGSDTMQSLQSGMETGEDVDLTGLIETTVDSDEDDDDMMAHMDPLQARDTVRDCLETDPANRSNEDIEILLEFTRHLRAFSNMTLSVRRALCSVMVFAVVQKAGTIVMQDGEELDSWSVIVNGHVQICTSGLPPTELSLGDSFGITPTMQKLYHRGIMRTKCDDCQFVCITQNDYYRILSQGEENTRRHEEDGKVVMVTENRIMDSGSGRGHIVIKGSAERLMAHLMEENSLVDPHYVEDFLLTRRIFIPDSSVLSHKLLHWFRENELRDRVTRVVLQWVNSHFIDFETDSMMMDFLERFEVCLEKSKMIGQLGLLNFECAAKSRVRVLTLLRASRDQPLPFSVGGGSERHFGIFIVHVQPGGKAETIGLKRGDQLLEVNGTNFERISLVRAEEIMRGATHLSISVKSNLLAFKEMLHTPEDAARPRNRKSAEATTASASATAVCGGHTASCGRLSVPPVLTAASASCTNNTAAASTLHHPHDDLCRNKRDHNGHKGFATLGGRSVKLRRALMKAITPKPPLRAHAADAGGAAGDLLHHSAHTPPSTPLTCQQHQHGGGGGGSRSHSNPDISRLTSSSYDDWKFDYPEHVLKIYRADQSFKYLLIHKETTAREVCMLSLREFGVTSDASSNYSLCEVTVDGSGFIKQRRLPDQLSNLAERIGLASRYYLRNNQVTDPLVPDELANDLPRETGVHILELNPQELAIQLTLEDFNIFRQIESTEYVDDLFELRSVYGTPSLRQFAELVNKEMFWVVTTVCSEHTVVRRMKIIKQFIKIARHCKECSNFNSMFNILSGLNHGAVGRLKLTWEKLPSKHHKMYTDMLELMDPSRNMSRYRNLINSEHLSPPMIPFYPIAKKDLTFIHLGNDTLVDGLVNFEKLRMIAKEIRGLLDMCSVQYDPAVMAEMVASGRCGTSAGASGSAGSATGSSHTLLGSGNTGTVKRRRKSTVQTNPKKMFEEAQMVRRVKAYLSHLSVVQDEDRLLAMSLECEPPPAGSTSTTTSRRRHPSPTLSTASTTSSTSANSESRRDRAKFGAASPSAVRKMMALAETKTRPHQPFRPLSSSTVLSSAGGGAGHHSHTSLAAVTPTAVAVANIASLSSLPVSAAVTPSSSSSSSSATTGSLHSPSPAPGRRRTMPCPAASSRVLERSQSETMPVDLSTESSCVSGAGAPVSQTRKLPPHASHAPTTLPASGNNNSSRSTLAPSGDHSAKLSQSRQHLTDAAPMHDVSASLSRVMYVPKAMPVMSMCRSSSSSRGGNTASGNSGDVAGRQTRTRPPPPLPPSRSRPPSSNSLHFHAEIDDDDDQVSAV